MTEPTDAIPRPPGGNRWAERVSIVAAMAAVLWFFHWSVELQHGFQRDLPDTYRLLVRGYLKGQLHLDATPDPRLKTLADPYDPAQNTPYRIADASYFNDRYYLYFGSVPALVLMVPYELVTGRELTTGAATLVFASVGFLAGCSAWLGIRSRWFPRSAGWMAPLGVLVLGFGTHVLALVRRPGMWELAITAGFAFTMLALFAVQRALLGRRTVPALVAAGFFLGLAVGSRPTCLLGAAMLLPPIWGAWRNPRPGAEWWRCALAGGVGLAVCGLAICAHNYARFGNPLEMGQTHQLSITKVSAMSLYSLTYVAHNLGVYFFHRPVWTWEFPFVSAQTSFPNIPGYFCTEEIAGIGVTLPLLWFVLFAPLAGRGRSPGDAAAVDRHVWSLAAAFLPVAGFLMMFCAATERYLADFTPALGLLALVGVLTVERWAQGRRWRFMTQPLVAALGAVTVLMGVLVSFDYHGRMLSRDQPAQWAQLERASHELLARIGVWTGQLAGPRVLKVRFKARPTGTLETFWQAGDARAGERIVVEHVGEHLIRFGYARGTAAVRWGRELQWEPEHTHTVELQLPSLYAAPQGALRGLRVAEEFRERSCVVLWFSGGRALAEIVEPLASEIVPGGAIGTDFSGEVRRNRPRFFRPDEFPPVDALTEPRGGTLRLRLVLPTTLAANGEPLLAIGAIYASDLVFVRDAGHGTVKFVFDHFEVARHESAPVSLAPGREHVVEIELPSCPAGSAFSVAATGEVKVRVNGAEVTRATSACHGFAAGEERVGRNPFGTTCAPAFRGWLLEARWTGAAGR